MWAFDIFFVMHVKVSFVTVWKNHVSGLITQLKLPKDRSEHYRAVANISKFFRNQTSVFSKGQSLLKLRITRIIDRLMRSLAIDLAFNTRDNLPFSNQHIQYNLVHSLISWADKGKKCATHSEFSRIQRFLKVCRPR